MKDNSPAIKTQILLRYTELAQRRSANHAKSNRPIIFETHKIEIKNVELSGVKPKPSAFTGSWVTARRNPEIDYK